MSRMDSRFWSKSMVRILHLIETGGAGGAETVLVNLVTSLPGSEWESRTIVAREGWLHDRLVERGADVGVLSSHGPMDFRYLLSLRREIRAFGPALVHAHFFGSGVYGSLSSSLAGGIPVVCTLHGAPDVNPSDPLLAVKARLLGLGRNRVVYVSYQLRGRLEPLLGLPPGMGSVIHNGVSFPQVEAISRGLLVPDLRPGVRLVGAVGNIRVPKDYPNLLHAARVLCDERSDVHFLIVGGGEGALKEELLRLRRDLGLETRVHLLGFRQDVPQVMRALDLFVSSSSDEGLPLATVEAMGMGLPVVLTECGGVPELVENGRTGLLVPVRNPEALAAGILELLDAPERSARLGSDAKANVLERFSLSSMVQAYERLYGSLLPRSPASHA